MLSTNLIPPLSRLGFETRSGTKNIFVHAIYIYIYEHIIKLYNNTILSGKY